MSNEQVEHSAATHCSTPLRVKLRRLWFRLFKRYRRLEYRSVSYREGDKLIRESAVKPERERWVLAEEEDCNMLAGVAVCLQRRERILE